ncbi:MAG: HipA N-terminal domain-containing protein [Limisphaerales bacterium]
MRKAEIYQKNILAGFLEEIERGGYRFNYVKGYSGEPISLALPVREQPYEFNGFPPVFEGLLPEGVQLEALLRIYKVDRGDLFQQLLIVGPDVVGSLTIREAK